MGRSMNDDHSSRLYDAVNLWGADDEFFLNFTTSSRRTRILDLGCGTGRITIEIARSGHSVTGVDPHRPSVEAARQKPGADQAEWVVGDSRSIPASHKFDIAIMSSNVVQAILDDSELSRTFRDIAARMPAGARLAFDSRDPDARGWEHWTKERSAKTVHLPGGPSHHWYQTTHVDETSGLVDFCAHEVDAEGREHIDCDRIRFRSEEWLYSLLTDAGFVVDTVYGGYEKELVGHGIGALVFTAHRH